MPAHGRDCRRAVRRDAGMQGDNGSDHRAGNTHFDHFSASGGSVFFKKPDRVLICDPKFVNASGFPSNDWFALAATAGSAVTGVDPKKLQAAAHRCQNRVSGVHQRRRRRDRGCGNTAAKALNWFNAGPSTPPRCCPRNSQSLPELVNGLLIGVRQAYHQRCRSAPQPQVAQSDGRRQRCPPAIVVT